MGCNRETVSSEATEMMTCDLLMGRWSLLKLASYLQSVVVGHRSFVSSCAQQF